MAVDYKVSGTDLSAIFWPLSGTAASPTNYQYNGTDLNGYFYPYTKGAKADLTGYQVNGTDLRDIFQSISVDPTTIGGDWPYLSNINSITLSPTDALAYIEFYSDGTFRKYENGYSVYYDYLTLTGAGKGNNFYIKYTTDSSENYNSGITAGAGYVDISTTRRIGQREVNTGEQSSNVTIYLAEDGIGTGAVSTSIQIYAFVEL